MGQGMPAPGASYMAPSQGGTGKPSMQAPSQPQGMSPLERRQAVLANGKARPPGMAQRPTGMGMGAGIGPSGGMQPGMSRQAPVIGNAPKL